MITVSSNRIPCSILKKHTLSCVNVFCDLHQICHFKKDSHFKTHLLLSLNTKGIFPMRLGIKRSHFLSRNNEKLLFSAKIPNYNYFSNFSGNNNKMESHGHNPSEVNNSVKSEFSKFQRSPYLSILITLSGIASGFIFGCYSIHTSKKNERKWSSTSKVNSKEAVNKPAMSSFDGKSSISNELTSLQNQLLSNDNVAAKDLDNPNSVLKLLNDDILDVTDNIFAIHYKSDSDNLKYNERNKSLINRIVSLKFKDKINFFYTTRTLESDEMNNMDGERDLQSSFSNDDWIICSLYKGQRKLLLRIQMSENNDLDALGKNIDIIKTFYKPVSETVNEISSDNNDSNSKSSNTLEIVTYDNFQEKVLHEVSASRPILLNLKEDTCFLCFIFRPFLNTINQIVSNHKIPVKLKTLNINRNDFPNECPIVRSTPTFILFKSPDDISPSSVWKEFKPTDFIEKFIQEFSISDTVSKELREAADDVQKRFRDLATLIIWMNKLSELQYQCLKPASDSNTDTDIQTGNDIGISSIIQNLMKEDSLRTDNLKENLEYLNSLIDSVKKDCQAFYELINPGKNMEDETLELFPK